MYSAADQRRDAKKSFHEVVILRTLHPERLATEGQHMFDLSGITYPTVRPLVDKPMVLIYASEDLPPSHPIVNIPSPQNAKGFFYYHIRGRTTRGCAF
jgi:hypothetical protein